MKTHSDQEITLLAQLPLFGGCGRPELMTLARAFVALPRRHPLVAGRIISRLADRRAPYEGLVVA